jgi:hypothetical protein
MSWDTASIRARWVKAWGKFPRGSYCTLQTRIDIARAEFDQAREALARCVPMTVRERLDVAILAARIACGRKSDDADTLLTTAIETAKVEGFVVAVTDDVTNLRSRVAQLLRSRHIGHTSRQYSTGSRATCRW